MSGIDFEGEHAPIMLTERGDFNRLLFSGPPGKEKPMPAPRKTILIGLIALIVALASVRRRTGAGPSQAPSPAGGAAAPQTAKAPLTVAEATNYAATSRYADVMAFIREIQKKSPYLRVETLCRSAEGRDVPLVIIGNPLPASPLDARTREEGRRLHPGQHPRRRGRGQGSVPHDDPGHPPPGQAALPRQARPARRADLQRRREREDRPQQPPPAARPRAGRGRADQRPEPRPQPGRDQAREPRGRRPRDQRPQPLGSRSSSSTATPRTAPGTSRP